MANYDEIKVFVETHYDLAVESVTPITHKSMKVRASNHDYLLKVASGDDDFIMKQLFAYKALSRNVLPIYRTKDNQHYVPWRDHFFYLTDYVQTIPLPLEQQIHYYIELLGKYLNVLSDREKLIIYKRYGFNGYDELTQKEIAKELNISRSYVSRIEKRAITKLLREFIRNNQYTK